MDFTYGYFLSAFRKAAILPTLFLLLNVVCSALPLEDEENGGKSLPDSVVELWLEDYTRIKDVTSDAMLSDSPGALSFDGSVPLRCPATPSDVTGTKACRQRACTSDRACALLPGFKCCFNGCVKTCLRARTPAHVVDWIREPPRDPDTGRSWLMRLEDVEPYTRSTGSQSQAVCSPSSNGNQPLCPIGYICHVTNPENMADYTGMCVPDDSDSAHNKFKITASKEGTLDCHIQGKFYRNEEALTYHKHRCTCTRGDVTCRVGKKRQIEEN